MKQAPDIAESHHQGGGGEGQMGKKTETARACADTSQEQCACERHPHHARSGRQDCQDGNRDDRGTGRRRDLKNAQQPGNR
jgi:hypothetical protein